MDNSISHTLRIGSLISTIFVVAIHYSSKAAIPLHDGYNLNYYIQEFLTVGLSRVAVPYFALLSGYFSRVVPLDILSFKGMFQKKFKKVFIPYLIASYFIFITSTMIALVIGDKVSIDTHKFLSSLKGLLGHPSIHLWFMRDLLVITLFLPVLLVIPKKIKILLTLLFGFLWFGEIQPLPIVKGWYFISIEILFFFVLGITLQTLDLNRLRFLLKKKFITGFSLIWSALICFRIYIKPEFNTWYDNNFTLESLFLYKTAILVGIIVLILVAYQLRNRKNILYLSGFNFFVYLYHFYPLFYFRRITGLFISIEYSFYIDLPIALLLSYFSAYLMNRYVPFIYNLISGNRSPR